MLAKIDMVLDLFVNLGMVAEFGGNAAKGSEDILLVGRALTEEFSDRPPVEASHVRKLEGGNCPAAGFDVHYGRSRNAKLLGDRLLT